MFDIFVYFLYIINLKGEGIFQNKIETTSMNVFDHECRRKRDLLCLLTKKEMTLKYKRTVLGILWSLLNPILLAIVL